MVQNISGLGTIQINKLPDGVILALEYKIMSDSSYQKGEQYFIFKVEHSITFNIVKFKSSLQNQWTLFLTTSHVTFSYHVDKLCNLVKRRPVTPNAINLILKLFVLSKRTRLMHIEIQ